MKGALFSIVLHLVILVLISGAIVLNFNQANKVQNNLNEASIMKLELGDFNALNANIEPEYSNVSSNNGLEENNYGRIISQIVLKQLNQSNIELINNRVDIVLKLSKDGKIINNTVLLKSHDPQLRIKITNALAPNRISFPPNPEAKGNLSYKLSLF